MSGIRGERGMVTAETAVVAPFLVVLGLVLAWVVSLGYTQVQLTDAAREGARVAARGEAPTVARAVARRHAPPGAVTRLERSDGLVTVRVSVSRGLPLLSGVGRHRLEASAVSVEEVPAGTSEDGP